MDRWGLGLALVALGVVIPGSAEASGLVLEIALPERADPTSGTVLLNCTVRNDSTQPTTFLWPGSIGPAPALVLARVWGPDGRLLTSNDVFADGWWTVHALKSSLYSEGEGDRFSLRPGESVAFSVDLAALLTACPCFPEGLAPGEYDVQLKSDAGLSNRLRIHVGEAK